ncbi:MAG: GNAT family N-acetyltransferase [Pseudomonadota bacterium]
MTGLRPVGEFRAVQSYELQAFRAHLLRLDDAGRRMRFCHSVNNAFIESYAARSLLSGGVTYGYFVDGILRAVAELRPAGPGTPPMGEVVGKTVWGPSAESAFSVEPDWQGRGVGTRLFQMVVNTARDHGVTHLYISCLPENERIQRIASKFDARLVYDGGDVMADIDPTHFNEPYIVIGPERPKVPVAAGALVPAQAAPADAETAPAPRGTAQDTADAISNLRAAGIDEAALAPRTGWSTWLNVTWAGSYLPGWPSHTGDDRRAN